MSNWYYYNDKGEKIAVTGGQLKGLAKAGTITPETIVETEDGKAAPARKVKGLTFVEAASPQPTSPPLTETNPFTATISESNPFTVAIPEDNPFTAAMQKTKSVHVPIAYETRRSFGATIAETMKSLMSVVASIVALILVLVLCGAVVWVLWWLWNEVNTPKQEDPKANENQVHVSTSAQTRQCERNMREIVLALHNYHEVHQAFPPLYSVDRNGKPLHSWRVLILPFVEESALYEQIMEHNEPWDSEYNKRFHDKVPAIYACPGNPTNGCCYSGIAGEGFVPAKAARPNMGRSMFEITDGTSNTLAIVEVKEPFCWMDPTADITLDELVKGINGSGRVGSSHEKSDTGGINAVMFDGTSRFIPQTIDKEKFRALGTIAGGESSSL